MKNTESDLLYLILKDRNIPTRLNSVTEIPIMDSVWRYAMYFDKVLPYLLQFIDFKIFDLKTNEYIKFRSLRYRCYKYNRNNCEGNICDFRIDNVRIIYRDLSGLSYMLINKFSMPITIDTIEYKQPDNIFDSYNKQDSIEFYK